MSRPESVPPTPVPRAWIAASLAFAFLVGLGLSIPLVHEMRLAPTGYDEAVSAAVREGTPRSGTVIEMNRPGPCEECIVSQGLVPAVRAPFVGDPVSGALRAGGVDV